MYCRYRGASHCGSCPHSKLHAYMGGDEEEMKLKEKLAKKFCSKKDYLNDLGLNPTQVLILKLEIESAWVAGFDRSKLHYVDYAQRFLEDPNLKPGDHHEKLFLQIGEQEYKEEN
jgi:hypothetical protein